MLGSMGSVSDLARAVPHLFAYVTLLWVVYAIGLCVWIILQKREPAATLSWTLSLVLIPYLGFFIYYVFGPQRIKRQRLRRERSRMEMRGYGDMRPTPIEHNELMRLAHESCGLPPSTARTVDLLVDGAAKYDALLEAIRGARDHVHMEYYIYCADQTGTAVRDALVERAREGVQVRLLLDAVGSSKLSRKFMAPLVGAGGEVVWFHPTQLRQFSRPWWNFRMHRKIAVIDGRIAFTGGINVTDDQNERVNPRAYRDLHLRLTGRVVRVAQLIFLEDWFYMTGQDRTACAGANLWPEESAQDGHIPAQLLVSGPDAPWEPIHRLKVSAIYEAKRRVWLVTPYFVPGEAARMALTSAALGGLDVRLIVPKVSDSMFVTHAARSYFDELLAAGITIHEYGPRMLHTKALLVDDDLAIFGSANFDHRSFRLNFDVSVMFQDRGVAADLEALIVQELDLAPAVKPLENRPFFTRRLPEAVARLFSPLL
jgi:cardiolipin synthase A/B